MQSLPLEPKIETPSKFIVRLYAAIDDPNVKSIIWSRHEASFLILDKEDFQQNVLPMISKTSEFSGFIRQLNAYGFKKRNNIDVNVREYAHPNFIRNRFDLLTKLSRRSTGIIKSESASLQNNIKFLNESNFRLTSEVLTLKNKVEEQDKKIKTLMEMFQQMFNMQADKGDGLGTGKFSERQLDYKEKKRKSPKYLRDGGANQHDDCNDFF